MLDVVLGDVVQQTPALADHEQEAAAAVMVALVVLEMLGEVGDALREQRDLHVGRTGVSRCGRVVIDDLLLGGSVHSTCTPLGYPVARCPRRWCSRGTWVVAADQTAFRGYQESVEGTKSLPAARLDPPPPVPVRATTTTYT